MKLAEWLKITGTRARDLAKAADTTEATISRLKHGHSEPSFDLARRISEATGGAVSANDFMGGKSAGSPQSSNAGLSASPKGSFAGRRVLLIIGGGIAAYKSLDLIRRIREQGGEVRVILTNAAQHFVTPLSVSALAESKAHTDLFDLTDETEIGHIRLARDTDIIVIAPATASLIARMANGLADDLAAAALLATSAPVLLAPAMNPHMWAHPATRRNVERLRADGISIVGPNEGEMAERGERGVGRMAEVPEIISAIAARLGARIAGPLAGAHVLVTSGPTREPLDPVRYIANRSSGRQGHAIALAARQLGARVTLISGPVDEPDPPGVDVKRVETADQMLAEAIAALPADIAVCAAAVADWKSAAADEQKMKKQSGEKTLTLTLARNPDILRRLAQHPELRPKLVIGFAAETMNVVANATEKRRAKGCDWIVANDVSEATGIMGGAENQVHLIDETGANAWPSMPKAEVGRRLMERAAGALKSPAVIKVAS